ncbi:MAG: hypothetical protein WC444_04665 [Candidatus Paceibacterota bacterium]
MDRDALRQHILKHWDDLQHAELNLNTPEILECILTHGSETSLNQLESEVEFALTEYSDVMNGA